MATQRKKKKKAGSKPKAAAQKKKLRKATRKKSTKKKKKVATPKKAAGGQPDLRRELQAQLEEVRAAIDELTEEFRKFREGLSRSSRSLLQGVIGFRDALASVNPLSPAALRDAGRRLADGVQRFVRTLQGR